MKRLFFVRHGETDLNVAGHFSGQSEALLTDNGRQQALATGKKIKTTIPQIDHIVCSPLGRAHSTAVIIAEEIGYPVDKIELNPLFLERNFGELEATPKDEYVASPDKYRKIDDAIGSETVKQLQERASKALEYVKSIDCDNVLVVGHGAFGRAFRRVVTGQPHTNEYNKLMRIGNAEIVELI